MIGISLGNGCSHLSVPVTASLCRSVSLKALIKSTERQLGTVEMVKSVGVKNEAVLGTC